MSSRAATFLVLAAFPACQGAEQDTGVQDSVEITVDEVGSTAALTMTGDRQRLTITATPEAATVAGVPFQELHLDISLGEVPDLGEDTDFLHGQLEGDIFDGSFTIDAVEYVLDPAPVAGGVILGPVPFHRADDALAATVGEAGGDYNFYRLDDAGFDFSHALRFTFTASGQPDIDIQHDVRVDYMVAEFDEL